LLYILIHFSDIEEEENETYLEFDKEDTQVAESPKKLSVKKQKVKNYNELVNILQQLSKYEWLEGNSYTQKLLARKDFL